MRAIVRDIYGDADVLHLADVPKPTIKPNEVLVRVHAAGVDRGAWHAMTGLPHIARLGFGLRRPRNRIPGLDLAGVVEAVGAEVTDFEPGDEVFGEGSSSWAEYARARPHRLLHKPPHLTFPQAAVIPTSGATALHMLLLPTAPAPGSPSSTVDGLGSALSAPQQPGSTPPGANDHDSSSSGAEDRGIDSRAVGGTASAGSGREVLVIGAGGGVGSFAVLLAKANGDVVTAVCSTGKVEAVRGFGADRVIDYTREPLTGSYDLIVDIAGNRALSQLRGLLKPRGVLSIAGGEQGGRFFGGLERNVKALSISPFVKQTLRAPIVIAKRDDLAALTSIRSPLQRTYPLEEASSAMHSLATGQIAGKVALTL